jgi:DNA end-binding protein Ku
MAARAIWKGVLHVGDEAVPLKLYSGVEDRSVHFRLLHAKDRVPVKQRMVNPETGEKVAYNEALRGYETDDGRMLILDEEDLAELEPEASRDIEVLRFVDPSEVPHLWYDRPYFLGPDGEEAGDAWDALAGALDRTGKVGVVRWTMRKKRYRGALRLHGGVPMLVTLRSASEVLPASQLEAPGGRKLEARELEMAEQLVEMLEGPFEPEEWEDTWRNRVTELVEAKAEGQTIAMGEYRERVAEGESLEKALAASLEAAGGRKSA